MRQPLRVLGLAALLLGLAVADGEAGPRCTRDYAPVCARGAHGARTWNNAACARAEHARILHAGRCRRDIEPVLPDPAGAQFCPMIDDPVCVERGSVTLTFPNLCLARAAGASLVHWGKCLGGPLDLLPIPPFHY